MRNPNLSDAAIGVSPSDLRRLIDEAAIREVHLRYCRGVDRRDWDLVRSCYHPDARDFHGPYNGDIDGFIIWAKGNCEAIEITQHLTGNQLVEIDGDVAWQESYTAAFHSVRATESEPAMHRWLRLRYFDRMERREAAWRIAHRMVMLDGQWAAPAQEFPGPWLRGRYDMSDPTYNRTRQFAEYFAGQESNVPGHW
jgi:SnoaL-like domain